MNGNGERLAVAKVAVLKNYKLLVDPMISGKKEAKVYRYEGVIPNDPSPPPVVRDPRNRISALSKRLEPLDLPIPR